MRIIAGRFRGRRLASVGKGDPGAHLRPTSDRVRESLFSMLAHLDVIEGARVLDLFAGTGALGIEALSRGAAEVTFVENGRVAGRLLDENVSSLGIQAETRTLRRDATRLGRRDEAPFDLVFMDPPYGKGLGEKALQHANRECWISDGALVVWEENAPMSAREGFLLVSDRRFGSTHITFLRKEDA